MTKHISRRGFVSVAVNAGIGLVLAACGGGAGGDAQPSTGQSAASAVPAAAAGSGGDVMLEIGSAGDDSKYDKDKLEAPAGSKITVKFTNNSKPASNKLFNWVLVKPEQLFKVVNDGLAEGESNGFVKPNDDRVIAYSKLLKAGESDTITFDAPPPGEYPYACTNPGYYVRMRGVLTIK